MARKRFTPEKINGMLREAEVRLSQGEKVKGICRSLGITEQTYYRCPKTNLEVGTAFGGRPIDNRIGIIRPILSLIQVT
jgi:hypothetical protein